MNWGEFKKQVDETEGVTDDIEIAWIDFSGHSPEACVDLEFTKDELVISD
tara:strand:+ start:260 stop:409 length:150 start_codon:yes stop_codon:yes gene_type:complete